MKKILLVLVVDNFLLCSLTISVLKLETFIVLLFGTKIYYFQDHCGDTVHGKTSRSVCPHHSKRPVPEHTAGIVKTNTGCTAIADNEPPPVSAAIRDQQTDADSDHNRGRPIRRTRRRICRRAGHQNERHACLHVRIFRHRENLLRV